MFLIQIRIALPPILVFIYVSIFQTTKCHVSKLSQQPKVVLKFECDNFKLIFVRTKIMYLRIYGSFKHAKRTGSANRKIHKSQKIYSLQIANPQIATFAEGPHI